MTVTKKLHFRTEDFDWKARKFMTLYTKGSFQLKEDHSKNMGMASQMRHAEISWGVSWICNTCYYQGKTIRHKMFLSHDLWASFVRVSHP